MRALFVNPHKLFPASWSITLKASPPLGLAYIAAAVEAEGFDVTIYDCIAEDPAHYFPYADTDDIRAQGVSFEKMLSDLQGPYDLIGVSTMFSNNWLINRDLINILKKRFPEALMIAGGEHVSAIPEYCMKDCAGIDAVVVGEGEETIKEIATHLKSGLPLEQIEGLVYRSPQDRSHIIANSRRKRIRQIGDIDMPAWHLFPLDKYFKHDISYGLAYGHSLPIFATRGCPYECTFCSSPNMWGMRYNMRDVDDVIREIKWLNTRYNVTNIDFFDLTAIINRRWILDFCRKVVEEGLVITFQIPAGTRAEAIDYEVAMALKKAGCKNITYAPESGSAEMLKSIKKKVVLPNMLSSIDESYRAGLNVKLNILLAYPDETVTDVLKTILFLARASIRGATDASPSVFNPYPGSALFDDLVAKNELSLSEEYFRSIVFSQSLHRFVNYNRNYSRTTLLFLLFLSYLVFYASNYLFRPVRFFRLLVNVYTKKYETRGEYMIGEILKRRDAIG